MTINQQLTAFFVHRYNEDKTRIKHYFEMVVPILTIIPIYEQFVKEESLIPIENLPEEKKIELVNECRATGLNFTNETLKRSARMLHTLKHINENS